MYAFILLGLVFNNVFYENKGFLCLHESHLPCQGCPHMLNLISSSFCFHIVCRNYCCICCCLLVLWLQFVGSMAPQKNLTNFKFPLFFSRNGGFATLGSTLALKSTTQNMLHVENAATTSYPQAIGPSSNTLMNLGLSSLMCNLPKRGNLSGKSKSIFRTLGLPSSHR
jgi:hypothetical protein